jgi:hypothetical protein
LVSICWFGSKIIENMISFLYNSILFIDELPLWSAHFGLKLLDSIKMKKNMNVLDIGSGLGFPAIEVAMRFNQKAEKDGKLLMSIPFSTFDCNKT